VGAAMQITEPLAFHGEGPIWFDGRQELRWVDMLQGDVLIFGSGGAVSRQQFDTPVVAALRPRRRGGSIIATERGFAIQLNLDSVELKPLAATISKPTERMNEGGCDPDGRFYCGSMRYDTRPRAGTLYRLNLDRTVDVVLRDLTISNGLDWSPDGALAYFVDTPTNQIDVFDYDTDRGLTGRRRFAMIPPDSGQPDGLTVDADGGVWVALWQGSAVHRYGSNGELDEIVEVPATNVTACTFGGRHRDELFITTSQQGVAPGTDPLAGALFHTSPGVTGQAVRDYWG